ncbi:MAG: class I SAM-dependent methyltransferase [Myxococcales bacterium]|nr:class I SAM-dependent methyltransferase [Myxococcales bacterium]MDH3845603.1 class I SAM-dependent methyltransferase [Myxococcales bacterium]
MGVREWIKPRAQDWAMRFMDDLRPEAVIEASGDVLEIGFGTGLNLKHYGENVRGLWGLDPMNTLGVPKVERRIERAPFPVERMALRADGQLPFDAGRFDCVVTTWTLCSIPDAEAALAEMRRVLKPGGRYLFIEHGRSRDQGTMRWQDRINPVWRRFTDGCNINRPVDRMVKEGGFELTVLDEFVGKGPRLISSLYRGIALKN